MVEEKYTYTFPEGKLIFEPLHIYATVWMGKRPIVGLAYYCKALAPEGYEFYLENFTITIDEMDSEKVNFVGRARRLDCNRKGLYGRVNLECASEIGRRVADLAYDISVRKSGYCWAKTTIKGVLRVVKLVPIGLLGMKEGRLVRDMDITWEGHVRVEPGLY